MLLIWVKVFFVVLLSSVWRSVCISYLVLHPSLLLMYHPGRGRPLGSARLGDEQNCLITFPPSPPLSPSLSFLLSTPLYIQCWKQAFWGRLRWWFSWSLPGTLGFPQDKLRPPLSDARNCWLCLFLTFSGFTSQLFRATNPPRVFSSEDLHAALMHHGNLRLIVLSH